MRVGLAVLTLLAAVLPAKAENRIFIVANNADGYGVDRCLATGARCGAPVASAYCHARDFARAVAFYKVDRDQVTGAIPVATDACSGTCEAFVAIECGR